MLFRDAKGLGRSNPKALTRANSGRVALRGGRDGLRGPALRGIQIAICGTAKLDEAGTAVDLSWSIIASRSRKRGRRRPIRLNAHAVQSRPAVIIFSNIGAEHCG
jgi:hypothetical protein